jgi:putative transcriptional regulator
MNVISEQVLKPIMAAQVRRIREQKGKSQDQLAKEVGVSRATINRIEQGHHVPDARLLYSLADALQVPTDDFRRLSESSAEKLAISA